MARPGRPSKKSVAMRKLWASKTRRERKEWAKNISKAQLKRWRQIRRAVAA